MVPDAVSKTLSHPTRLPSQSQANDDSLGIAGQAVTPPPVTNHPPISPSPVDPHVDTIAQPLPCQSTTFSEPTLPFLPPFTPLLHVPPIQSLAIDDLSKPSRSPPSSQVTFPESNALVSPSGFEQSSDPTFENAACISSDATPIHPPAPCESSNLGPITVHFKHDDIHRDTTPVDFGPLVFKTRALDAFGAPVVSSTELAEWTLATMPHLRQCECVYELCLRQIITEGLWPSSLRSYLASSFFSRSFHPIIPLSPGPRSRRRTRNTYSRSPGQF